MPSNEHFIPVAGGMLRVAVKGTGIPLICVHGWTMNASMWIYQNDLINAGVQLITYDRRAYGASTAGFDPTQEVADVPCMPSGPA